MKKEQNGFILPMIVVTGLVLMVVMAFTLQTISISRDNLINQRAQLLARQAAESGLARAQQCLQASNQVIRWTNSKPLKPNTNCQGDLISGMSEYITNVDGYRSRFEVYPADAQDDFRTASAIGFIEVASGGSSAAKSYSHTMSAYIKTGLTFDDIQFGSIYNFALFSNGTSDKLEAVYFHTKTLAGVIKGVGRNVNSTLSGVPGDDIFQNGVNLDLSGLPGVKIKKIVTDFQGNGWGTYFVTYNDEVYATGDNGRAIKGNGFNLPNGDPDSNNDAWPHKSKVLLPKGTKIKDLLIGGSEGYFVTTTGELYVVGTNWPLIGSMSNSNWQGALGCYNNCNLKKFVNTPVRVMTNSKNLENVDKIVTDTFYFGDDKANCAIANTNKNSNDRNVYCWGYNGSWQVNPFDNYLFARYAKIIYSDQSDKPVDVVTDGHTVYILTEKGKVWGQGDNTHFQLGHRSASYCQNNTTVWRKDHLNNFTKTGCKLHQLDFNGKKITKIVADSYSALFLDEDGTVWGSGLNDMGQLGNGSYDNGQSGFRKFKLPNDVRATDIFIASPGLYYNKFVSPTALDDDNKKRRQGFDARHYRNSFVITEDGDVYGAGANTYGQLGVGNKTTPSKTLSECGIDSTYNEARAAASHSAPNYGSSNSNTFYAYGYRSPGVSNPVKMCLISKKADGTVERHKAKINGVRAGMGTTIVITDKNRVFTVGHNHQGQLGAGDLINRSIPEAHRLTNLWNVYYY